MFSIDQFVSDCDGSLAERSPALAIRDHLARALSTPDDVAAAFDAPTRAELAPIYVSAELSVLKLVWAPGMRLPPHDHRMWAVIGIYGGAEHNRFYRRTPDGIVASGERSLDTTETLVLGTDAVHAVTNPNRQAFTGAIHVYGGDFLKKPRSRWDPDTFVEEPATGEVMRAMFDAANRQLGAT